MNVTVSRKPTRCQPEVRKDAQRSASPRKASSDVRHFDMKWKYVQTYFVAEMLRFLLGIITF